MFGNPFNEIMKEDIDRLVTEGRPEDRELEYKAELPRSGNNEDKREFAKDVSAFANGAGGYILYGVTEKKDAQGKSTGIPEAAEGLPDVNPDELTRGLQQKVWDTIDPRIIGVDVRVIPNFPKGPVAVLRIPKSWNAPHIVKVERSQFFARRNAMSLAMDVQEIRSAFVLSAEMPALIRRFRDERLGRIMADETPVRLERSPRVVMHLIPFSSVRTDAPSIDLAAVEKSPPPPMENVGGWNHHYNFDGFVTYAGVGTEAQFSYLQVFRSGALETTSMHHSVAREGRLEIYPSHIETQVLDGLNRYIPLYKTHGIEPPIVIAITLLHFKGAALPPDPYRSVRVRPQSPIDRDALLLPDVLISDYGDSLPTLMRPVFDALWQSVGDPRSPSYDKDGNWNQRRHR